MLLRKKTQIIVGIAFALLIIVLYAASRVIFLDRFTELEKQDTRHNVEWVLSALSNELSTLDSLASDWAARGDTFAFAQDPVGEFILSRLADEIFIDLKLNLVLLITPPGEIVFSKAFDLQSKQAAPLPPGLQEHLDTQGPLLDHPDVQSSLTGVALLPQGPLLVASRPVWTGEATGPIDGTLILGRYLDSAETRHLAQITRSSLTWQTLDDPQMPDDLAEAQASLLSEDTILIRSLSASRIAGYTLIRDIYEQPALILKVSLSREIYTQGQVSLLYFLTLLAIGLVFGGITMLALQRTLLSRLTRLSTSVSQIGAEGDLTARVTLTGEDELASLAGEINKTLTALERSQNELRESEQRFRSIVEQSVDGIVMTDELGNIIEWNRGEEQITGLGREAVLGRALWDIQFKMIPDEQKEPALYEQLETSLTEFFQEGQAPWMNVLQEQDIQRSDGSRLTIQTLAFPIRTDKGWMSGSISRDITELKQAQVQLSQHLEEQETLFAIGRLVSSSLQIDDVTQKVAEHMTRLVGAASCVIFDWHPEIGRLTLKAQYIAPNNNHHANTEQKVQPTYTVPDHSLLAAAIQNSQPFTVYRGDPQADPHERRLLQDQGWSGMAGIPIVIQDRLIGLAQVYLAEKAEPFSEHDLRLLQVLANQVAIAIDNARLFATVQANEAALRDLSLRLIDVQERERRQIAQELHDELGQLLTAIKINIDLAWRKLPDELAALQRRLEDASTQTDQVLRNVRSLTVELRPHLLDDMGILPTLRWYLGRFAQLTNLRAELEAQELPARLLPEIETAIYRGVQEALTNIARHARASQVNVRLALSGDQVVITIQDDGQGFDARSWAERRDKHPTLGLRGIEERVMLLGGHVLIESQPGQGVRVDIVLPAHFSAEREL